MIRPGRPGAALRVVLADDEVLLRQGLSVLLAQAGIEVVGTAGDLPGVLAEVARRRPDVALLDIRMPPTHTDEGLTAAAQIRRDHPGTGVLVLSHYLDPAYAARLLEDHPEGTGYLLKDRVSDIVVLVDALDRIADGESVVDPTIVARLMRQRRSPDPVGALSEREREVLSLMAQGQSNAGIADLLVLSPRTVERHIGHIFTKLALPESESYHRRVLAILTLLREP